MEKIDTVAFDLGGVLANQDKTKLTDEERYLFDVYMNRFKNPVSEELLRYAKSRMKEIMVKIYFLNKDAIETLEMLKSENINISIWTNSIEEINAWFESIDIYRYLKHEDIVNSYYLNVDKPKEEFYRKALEQIKKTNSQVFFFDDGYQNVIAARRCGINAWQHQMDNSLKKEVMESLLRRSGK